MVMANDAPSPVAALPDAMVEKPARHAHRGFSGALAGKELDDDARFATAAAHAMPLRQGIESSAARAREDRCLLVPRTHVAPRPRRYTGHGRRLTPAALAGRRSRRPQSHRRELVHREPRWAPPHLPGGLLLHDLLAALAGDGGSQVRGAGCLVPEERGPRGSSPRQIWDMMEMSPRLTCFLRGRECITPSIINPKQRVAANLRVFPYYQRQIVPPGESEIHEARIQHMLANHEIVNDTNGQDSKEGKRAKPFVAPVPATQHENHAGIYTNRLALEHLACINILIAMAAQNIKHLTT
ncbi:unnamed protein product [Diplocarpon coronariae]